MNILITGGAGFIGSHAVKLFLEQGHKVVVFDNLFRGFKEVIEVLSELGDLEFVEGDLRDLEAVRAVFKQYEIEAVLHFAALCLVDESMREPNLYFENNVGGSMNLLRAMTEAGVKNIIFSSTSAVYNGFTAELPIKEETPADPLNPYGDSKYMVERMIKWDSLADNFNYVIFRYFNVCGSSSDGLIGDSKKPSQLLMQNAVRGAMGIESFYYTYQEVETPDGSPIRDYIDVEDLVEAHYKAYEYLVGGGKSEIFNLGNGKGYSTKEIVKAVEAEFGQELEKKEAEERRQGENKAAYTDPSKAEQMLGWRAKKSLQDSIRSLRGWYTKRPNGWDY